MPTVTYNPSHAAFFQGCRPLDVVIAQCLQGIQEGVYEGKNLSASGCFCRGFCGRTGAPRSSHGFLVAPSDTKEKEEDDNGRFLNLAANAVAGQPAAAKHQSRQTEAWPCLAI